MTTKQRKIALMGFRSVGKSSLTIQFVEGQFVDSYDPTIENTFYKKIKVKGQEYSLKLVDTAGQDEYSIFPHEYALDIHGYCLVYSINNLKSFEVVKVIYDKLLELTGKIQVPIILVGNKVDLHLERCVSTQDGKDLANYMHAQFVEVSAKENSAVNNLFTSLIMAIEHGLPTSSSSSLLSSSSSANKTANDHQTIDQTNNKHNKCIVS
ncbi:ras homolog enriched in brain [Dermatophagoides pteronyssinus]|uniref:GTP-binding protein Rheb homolog n=1 Tax=Dermatophagoides pteronyssinus TaxID=6956 RepID=A0A6P6XPR6_DERPT|nr:GTP-binding protein Rheb homolog [Dermatophagoides pteronyssinus]